MLSGKAREVLGVTCLSNILPVLSSSVAENLATDLERVVTELGKRHDEIGLRPIAMALRSFVNESKRKEQELESELSIDFQ